MYYRCTYQQVMGERSHEFEGEQEGLEGRMEREKCWGYSLKNKRPDKALEHNITQRGAHVTDAEKQRQR